MCPRPPKLRKMRKESRKKLRSLGMRGQFFLSCNISKTRGHRKWGHSMQARTIFSDLQTKKFQKNSHLDNNANAAHFLGLRSSIEGIGRRQRQQYTLLQEQTKILHNLQSEIHIFTAILEKMPNLPGAEPGREKKSVTFYLVEFNLLQLDYYFCCFIVCFVH